MLIAVTTKKPCELLKLWLRNRCSDYKGDQRSKDSIRDHILASRKLVVMSKQEYLDTFLYTYANERETVREANIPVVRLDQQQVGNRIVSSSRLADRFHPGNSSRHVVEDVLLEHSLGPTSGTAAE